MKPWHWFGSAAAFVIAVWLISWALITWQLGNPDKPGVFGDMFGAVNALFSGLAFAGIIVAILMQRRDLEIQREELRLQREELVLQREEMARASNAQEAQGKVLLLTARLNANTALLENKEIMHNAAARRGQTDPEVEDDLNEGRYRAIRILLDELDALA